MINLDFLDTAVNAETMIFMDYIITNRKIRKACNLPSFIGPTFFSGFFLFLTKDIRLRNHGKPNEGILVSPLYISMDYHDLTRLYYPLRILTVKSIQIFL